MKLKSLRDSLQSGYRIELQGAVEESAKSQTSINEKMPAMLLTVLLLLMVQLQRVGKTLIICPLLQGARAGCGQPTIGEPLNAQRVFSPALAHSWFWR
jgi:multidrug efflux pump subunit AcrB